MKFTFFFPTSHSTTPCTYIMSRLWLGNRLHALSQPTKTVKRRGSYLVPWTAWLMQVLHPCGGQGGRVGPLDPSVDPATSPPAHLLSSPDACRDWRAICFPCEDRSIKWQTEDWSACPLLRRVSLDDGFSDVYAEQLRGVLWPTKIPFRHWTAITWSF